MPIRSRVDSLIERLASEPQFPTQGQTIFVDLERREIRRAWMPRRVVETFLGGRGVNISLSRHHRNAVSVLPLPVGAKMSVQSPPAIAGQPSCCARVG